MEKFLQTHHIVQAICPQGISTVGRTGDIISLKNYDHVTVMFEFGAIAAGADADLTFFACTTVAGAGAQQITPVTYRQMLTATDTWTAASSITNGTIDVVSSGHIQCDEDCCTVVVEFDACQINNAGGTLPGRLDCFYAVISAPGAGSTITVGAHYILWNGCRYEHITMPTAITD